MCLVFVLHICWFSELTSLVTGCRMVRSLAAHTDLDQMLKLLRVGSKFETLSYFLSCMIVVTSTWISYNTNQIEQVQLVFRKRVTCLMPSHYCVQPSFGYFFFFQCEEHQ
jgi:hypothetical protein